MFRDERGRERRRLSPLFASSHRFRSFSPSLSFSPSPSPSPSLAVILKAIPTAAPHRPVRTSVRPASVPTDRPTDQPTNQPTNQPTLRPSPSLIRRKRSIHHGRLRVPTFHASQLGLSRIVATDLLCHCSPPLFSSLSFLRHTVAPGQHDVSNGSTLPRNCPPFRIPSVPSPSPHVYVARRVANYSSRRILPVLIPRYLIGISPNFPSLLLSYRIEKISRKGWKFITKVCYE